MTLPPATSDQMREQGFPETIQRAFQETAEETQCIILSRVPGGATTELIEAGYDLKGFFIKAKSCDWGPMSGFLCQVPAFNKKGRAGIKYNAEQNLKYYDKFCDRLHRPQEGLNAASGSSDAVARIKSIFEQGKLKWQEVWGRLLWDPSGDSIAKTRTFLKEPRQQNLWVNSGSGRCPS